jgi:4-amino-4-deoxy-L-arabinose transferase-like glycosyltransferase
VIADDSLLSESLFVCLELGAIACALALRRDDRLRWAAGAGVLAGLAALTRSNGAILLLPLAAGVMGSRPWLSWRAAAPAVALVAAALLVIAPWTARNAHVMHAFIPVSTQLGFALAGTYNDESAHDSRYPGAWRLPLQSRRYAALFGDRSLGEAALERKLRSRAISYAVHHPLYVLRAGWWNTRRLLDLGGLSFSRLATRASDLSDRVGRVSRWSFWLAGLLALAGAVLPPARRAPRFLWACPVLLLLTIVFISGSARYRTPLEPFVIILAALALSRIPPRRPAA